MDALNTRESAILIWSAVLLVWAIWKAKAWPALRGLVRSFCKPILLRAIALMALYVSGCVWLLDRVDLWNLSNLKTTVVWFGTFVLGWIFNLKRWDADPNKDAGATLRELLNVTVLVTFLTEFYTFNLMAELVFVPVVSFAALMAAIADGKSETAIVGKVFNAMLALLGWGLLAYATYRLATDFSGFATIDTGREFAVPGLLSLLFLPFMYLFNIWAAYETVGRVLPIALKQPGLARYALLTAIVSFGLNVGLLRRWRAALFNLKVESRGDVRRAVAIMKAAQRRERHPPVVPPEEGWSPYAAATWLTGQGLAVGDYNPHYADWGASSPYRKLAGGVLGDSLAYYISGSASAATKLTLTLNCDRLRKDATPQSSLSAFSDALIPLMVGAYGEKALPALHRLKNKRHRTKQGFATAVLKEDEDTLRLTITHQAHVEPF